MTANSKRRFDVELFIVHPTMSPNEISSGLGMEAHVCHADGAEKTTPKGTRLPGICRDTRWRHSVRKETDEQWFAAEIAAFVDSLVTRKEFLHQLRATGGRTEVIIQFLGDGYFGDEISTKTLAKLADLDLDLGIECFVVPQHKPIPPRTP